MKQRTFLIILVSCLVIAVGASQRSGAQDVSSQSKLIGKWTIICSNRRNRAEKDC